MAAERSKPSRRAVEVLLNAGLNAVRLGALPSLTSRHRYLEQALRGSWLTSPRGVLGSEIPPAQAYAEAGRALIEWAISQLRPDRRDGLEGIDEAAWLYSTSWRPMLAIACHSGLIEVPSFPQRYRRRSEETPLENLCGIWAVGPSTVYRYLDKARRKLVELLLNDPNGPQRLSLRRVAYLNLMRRGEPQEGWTDWHRRQGEQALMNRTVVDGLWHLCQAGDVDAFLDAFGRHIPEVSASLEVDEILGEVERRITEEQLITLLLRRAALWRARGDQSRAEESLRRALGIAEHLGQPLRIGIVQVALGHHLEERDRDRAIGLFEDSLRWLRRAVTEPGPSRVIATNEYAQCIVHLAWTHLRRNNPKAKTLLEQLRGLDPEDALDDRTLASTEQVWGEYWRCVGHPQRALEHKHRALAVYQRLGDLRSVLNTLRNLSLIYSDAKDFDRAIEYGNQVVETARKQAVEPEVLAGAHVHIGIAYFFQGQFDQAIKHYLTALDMQTRAGLRAQLIAVNYNLAEAYYERFKQKGQLEDERLGDDHATLAARLSAEDKADAQADAARSLKREILGTGDGPDRLLPTEHAAHFAEMAEIERLRLTLALPQSPEQQARTHLSIARAYIAIANKERETALAIASRHGLETMEFQAELDTLRTVFSRELTREQQLDEHWSAGGSDLLSRERRQSVVAHVLAQGSINKSTYAEVVAVSLATASKHLGLLTERGLLVQTGKGPSTRYLLP